MDDSAVQAIVENNLRRLMQLVGVPHWVITVEYGSCGEDGWSAQCDLTGVDYWQATITIDPRYAKDEEDVLKSLVHELIHILLAPLNVYRDVITSQVPGMRDHNSLQSLGEHRTWTHAIEQTVLGIERGLARELKLTEPPKKLKLTESPKKKGSK